MSAAIGLAGATPGRKAHGLRGSIVKGSSGVPVGPPGQPRGLPEFTSGRSRVTDSARGEPRGVQVWNAAWFGRYTRT